MRALFVLAASITASHAHAMCGFFVAPDTRGFATMEHGKTPSAHIVNRASKVILVREGDVTVMTLANDFEGAPKDFGLVVPVPAPVTKDDVSVVSPDLFNALDEATAPHPTVFHVMCGADRSGYEARAAGVGSGGGGGGGGRLREDPVEQHVKVESQFYAGEYDVSVLSSDESAGLVAWLKQNKYAVPDDAVPVVDSYVKQNMHFLVAHVRVSGDGSHAAFLHPIRVRYTSPKFVLPIRLGTVNADGPQEIVVFAVAPEGRVEPVNYRLSTIDSVSPNNRRERAIAIAKLEAAEDGRAFMPITVLDHWSEVYEAIFVRATEERHMETVFVEDVRPISGNLRGQIGATKDGFITRLHARYDAAHFPEDLVLQTTFAQHRFSALLPVMRQGATCLSGPDDDSLKKLSELTGWKLADVRKRFSNY